ncbi:Uncharacterized protein Adt_44845 [Abeliophyllum distichum]|uniref:Uncharacterized protein n=1 Tax=Abeliophyllum distichum TaxID=126358 RepID=A0ABD1PC32_9LAMI
MPRVKIAAKRPRRERPPSPSSEDEDSPSEIRIAKCPVLIEINEYVSLKILFDPFFMLRKVVFAFIPQKPIPHTEEYNPIEACCHVTSKHFETVVRLSTNQLTLPCHVLHNIIAHIIVPRKGHLDEVNQYDVFLLDSILRGRKLDFSYIMIQHMTSVLSGTRPKALPYGMILTKNFQHFEISFRDLVAVLPKATDTINVLTLKQMKIFKENGQWVAKSKGFDDESGPSTLPFEGEDIHDDEDAPPPSPSPSPSPSQPRPRSHRPSSSTSGFNEDDFNLLNGRIDSLASTVDGLQHALSDLQNTAANIQTTVGGLQNSIDGITSLLHALHSHLGTGFPPPLPLEM